MRQSKCWKSVILLQAVDITWEKEALGHAPSVNSFGTKWRAETLVNFYRYRKRISKRDITCVIKIKGEIAIKMEETTMMRDQFAKPQVLEKKTSISNHKFAPFYMHNLIYWLYYFRQRFTSCTSRVKFLWLRNFCFQDRMWRS